MSTRDLSEDDPRVGFIATWLVADVQGGQSTWVVKVDCSIEPSYCKFYPLVKNQTLDYSFKVFISVLERRLVLAETNLLHKNYKFFLSYLVLSLHEINYSVHQIVSHFNRRWISASDCTPRNLYIWFNINQHPDLLPIYLLSFYLLDQSFLLQIFEHWIELGLVEISLRYLRILCKHCSFKFTWCQTHFSWSLNRFKHYFFYKFKLRKQFDLTFIYIIVQELLTLLFNFDFVGHKKLVYTLVDLWLLKCDLASWVFLAFFIDYCSYLFYWRWPLKPFDCVEYEFL